jgi:hypothetical protein
MPTQLAACASRGHQGRHLVRQVHQTQRARLWTEDVEMGEKVFVTRVEQTRSVLGHDDDDAGQAENGAEVTMEPLVKGLEAQQMIRRRKSCRGAFLLPSDRWSVAGATGDGAFANVRSGRRQCHVVQCSQQVPDLN